MSQQLPEPPVEPKEGGDDGRPDWLPENFKSPEDLAKSYDETRREMNRLQSALDTQQQQFSDALAQIEAAQATPQPEGLDPQTNQMLADWKRAVDEGDANAQLAITLSLQQQLLAQALDERFKTLDPKLEAQATADRDIAFEIASERVAKSYGDGWGELQPDVQKWLREHQSWLPAENKPEAFEQVIREAARTVENGKLAEKARADEADRAAKLAAATGDGSGQGRHPIVTPEKDAAWNEIKAADVGSYSGRRSPS